MPHIQTAPKPLLLLSDIRKRPWFIHDHEALLPRALAFMKGEGLGADIAVPETYLYTEEQSALPGLNREQSGRVAVIPITGAISKYDGMCTYGAETYVRAIRQAAETAEVCALVLDIDSGGGAGNAIGILKEAVAYARNAEKPVIAHVDYCASLAYWLASQCDAIFCDSPASEVGSIGAYCHIIDDTGALEKEGYTVITVYADESPDKNLDYRKALEGDTSLLKKELSFLVSLFHSDVKAGRPDIKADAPGVFTGAMFYAAEAMTLGMINGIATLSECIENAAIRAQYSQIP